ncbi:MAG: hypothetical protein MZW92_72665 [Comamonadaceae bacterium]|nr:hypothetical protein [Comamonadaceae bacterium]
MSDKIAAAYLKKGFALAELKEERPRPSPSSGLLISEVSRRRRKPSRPRRS